MDLDDGIYFPLTYVEGMSQVDFEKAATVLRGVVYEKAKDLSWKCVLKPKCIRVIISSDAQIDLPIYSIPDEQLKTVTEAKAKTGEFSSGASAEVNLLSYDSAKGILLATNDGWIKSDPRVIHKWVQDSKEKHEGRFTKYSKFLKAWRDHRWVKSNFSSIMIMAGIEMALSEPDYEENDNVALDLEFIVRKISMALDEGGKGIKDPDGRCRLDENLDNREEIIGSLRRLANCLNKATKTNDVELLINEFGKRFPVDIGKIDASNAIAPVVAVKTTSSSAVRPSKKC